MGSHEPHKTGCLFTIIHHNSSSCCRDTGAVMKRDSNAWKKGRKYFQVALGSVEAAQVVIAKDRLKVKTDRQLLMGLIAGLSTPASR